MKRVLSERRARLSNDFDHAEDDTERESLRRDLKKLDEQIAILAEEAEITKFVEDAVRVGIEMRRWSS
jgi:GTP cyclohydrolase FolE2